MATSYLSPMLGRGQIDFNGEVSPVIAPSDRCGGCPHVFPCARESRDFCRLLMEHWKVRPVVVGPSGFVDSGAKRQQSGEAPKLPSLPTTIREASYADSQLLGSIEQPSGDLSAAKAEKPADAPPRLLEIVEDKRSSTMDEPARKNEMEDDAWTGELQLHSIHCNGCERTSNLDGRDPYVHESWEERRDDCQPIQVSKGEVRVKKKRKSKPEHRRQPDDTEPPTSDPDLSHRKPGSGHTYADDLWRKETKYRASGPSLIHPPFDTREGPSNFGPICDEEPKEAESSQVASGGRPPSARLEPPHRRLLGLGTIDPDDDYWKVQPFAVFGPSSPLLTARARKRYRCSTRYELLQYSRWGPAGRRWSS